MNMKAHTGILLLLVAIIGWFAVVRPQISTFSDRSLQVKVASTELDSYNQRLADLQTIRSQGSSVTNLIKNMYLAMPRSSQIPEVLVMIENIGGNSGVVMNGVSLGTSSPTSGTVSSTATAEVPVSISFTGSLDSVTKFLNAIRDNIRTATVKSQTISADKSGALSVTMQIGLVYQGGQ